MLPGFLLTHAFVKTAKYSGHSKLTQNNNGPITQNYNTVTNIFRLPICVRIAIGTDRPPI